MEVGGRAGSPAEHLARIGGSLEGIAQVGRGRAGGRLAYIAAIARHLSR